ncbi:MAG: DNA mismatch repair protein MutS [Pseudomonadota bacterium]
MEAVGEFVSERPESPAIPSAEGATPMMAQYLAIKAQHPEGLLWYRMGDFYELFFEDAQIAADALNIHCTTRGTHAGKPIPMAGVPVHASQDYLARLIAQNFRVAIAEQVEDPAEAKKRGAKSVVARKVTRIVTPGTITEEELLEPGRRSLLVALAANEGRFALAAADVASGRFILTSCAEADLAGELARLEPAELLMAEEIAVRAPTNTTVTHRLQPRLADARAQLASAFGAADLDAYGSFSAEEAAAGLTIVQYLAETQIDGPPPLDIPRQSVATHNMVIDAATRASLELARPSREGGPTLLTAIDRTVTGPGAQRLADRITSPSTEVALIGARHDAVSAFLSAGAARAAVRAALKGAPDILRAVGRLAAGRGRPRDALHVARGLEAASSARAELPPELPALLSEASADLAFAPGPLGEELSAALDPREAAANAPDGFIAKGIDKALDEARTLRDESRRVIAALQAEYQDATGVRALKIKHNAVLGWFVETPASHGERLIENGFSHRQTLASAMRFTTERLRDLESRILGASEDVKARESAIFAALTEKIVAARDTLSRIADAIAEVDVAAALAEIAAERRFVRPIITEGTDFVVEGGRHPVVEGAMDDPSRFVPNDCALSPDTSHSLARSVILTGPNMGGKSTYLRQNALVALLAQAGAFVPATSARVGIVDRLFSRIGASDDLAAGRSTFMVEMVELAAILNQAGPRALVVLDEIGRGTATFDGLSIAWAALERLDEIGCRTLFATHYHELTALAQRRPRIGTSTIRVKEWRGDIIFLHQVAPGTADRSYGVQVARLAGLPAPVVRRAKDILARLEESDRGAARDALAADLPLFAQAAPDDKPEPPEQRLIKLLDAIDPDALSPKEAHELLYKLKAASFDEVGDD